jgi:hypothetical protein
MPAFTFEHIIETVSALTAVGVVAANLSLARTARDQMTQVAAQADQDQQNVKDQIAASSAIATATREATRAALQPMVFAQITGVVTHDHGYAPQVGDTEIGFTYRLENAGSGLAINVRHGVAIADRDKAFGGGDGMGFSSLRAGEKVPPDEYDPLLVAFMQTNLPADWAREEQLYWVEFADAFGNKFRTVVSSNPTHASEFIPLEDGAER